MTQNERIVEVLEAARSYEGDPQTFGFQGDGWVAIEHICSIPGGGLIMEPHARRIELANRGVRIETRSRKRTTAHGSYRASDWRLANE